MNFEVSLSLPRVPLKLFLWFSLEGFSLEGFSEVFSLKDSLFVKSLDNADGY